MHTTVCPPECYCPCHVLVACHRDDRAVPFAHRIDNQGLLNPVQEEHTVRTMVDSQPRWFVQATCISSHCLHTVTCRGCRRCHFCQKQCSAIVLPVSMPRRNQAHRVSTTRHTHLYGASGDIVLRAAALLPSLAVTRIGCFQTVGLKESGNFSASKARAIQFAIT